MALTDFHVLTPLGSFSPPDHTLPTNHQYLYWVDPDNVPPGAIARRSAVHWPGSGTVQQILHMATDPQTGEREWKVWIAMTTTFTYYLDHIILDAPLAVGQPVTAGQRLGTNSGLAIGIDLGVVNQDVVQPFIAPERHGFETVHADAVQPYFAEVLRAQLYGKSSCLGGTEAQKRGQVCQDVAGTLAGDWFRSDAPNDSSAETDPAHWGKHLCFGRFMDIPDRTIIAIGGAGMAFVGWYAVDQSLMDPATRPPQPPEPAQVTPATGLVVYRLFHARQLGINPIALFLVRMVSTNRIEAEATYDLTASGFSGAQMVFTRSGLAPAQ